MKLKPDTYIPVDTNNCRSKMANCAWWGRL